MNVPNIDKTILPNIPKYPDIAPILEKLDKIGYWSVECWGGATFDSCMRYLGESPWDRVCIIKKHMPSSVSAASVPGAVTAPMPGTVIAIDKKVGDHVEAGDKIMTIEAMKMENEIRAEKAGNIKEIRVSQGSAHPRRGCARRHRVTFGQYFGGFAVRGLNCIGTGTRRRCAIASSAS